MPRSKIPCFTETFNEEPLLAEPSLVLIIMTPLEALFPYNAVEEASFSTDILLMS